MQMDSYHAAAQLALGGVTPALIPISVIKTHNIQQGYCFHFPLLDELKRPIHVCYRSTSFQSNRIRNLIDLFADNVPQLALTP
jgi:DNA-binding transcriptional LysR family regulator